MFENLRDWYHNLPDKKKHIEFLTAILSVPVLLTVLITNVNNLRSRDNEKTNQAANEPNIKIITVTAKDDGKSETEPTITPSPTTIMITMTPTTFACKKEVGPIKISRPVEDELVNSDSVCFDINYTDANFCSVTWSYRIDSGDWSGYTDKNFCLSNLSPGPKEMELRVKSSSTDEEITLVRKFYFKNKQAPTATPVPPTLVQ